MGAGCLFLALGLNLFLVPIRLSPGGISTLATIGLYLFKLPLALTNLGINAVLFLLGYRYLGKQMLTKAGICILMLSFFLQLTARIPHLPEDLLLSTVSGGILVGFGVGLVIRQEGSTGGSDFAALLLHRFFPHISIAGFILGIDFLILILAGVIFESVTVTFYSLLSLVIAVKVTNLILSMGNLAKSVLIISPRSEAITTCIQERFARGVTGIYGKGMYGKTDRLILLCAVSPKELPALVHTVRELDKKAFLIIFDAREVVGEGFLEKLK